MHKFMMFLWHKDYQRLATDELVKYRLSTLDTMQKIRVWEWVVIQACTARLITMTDIAGGQTGDGP